MFYRWPEAAAVARTIPKERLYAEGAVRQSVRQRIVDEVKRIRWAYKLGEESIRLTGSADVPEIQVFEIELKGLDVSESVLQTIDKAVPSPIYFELQRVQLGRREVRPVAARKQLGLRGSKISQYFYGSWASSDVMRAPLPTAIDLDGLYAQLLTTLMPISVAPGEDLLAAIERATHVRKVEREIASLSRRLSSEPQFNRKVELRRELRACQAELDALNTNAVHVNARTHEDATWRS